MRISRIVVALLIVVCTMLSACFSDSPSTGPSRGQNDDLFPTAIGMLWKYQVYDSLTQTTDTVWYSITDTTTVRTDSFLFTQREKYFTSAEFGWSYLSLRQDTVEYFDDTTNSTARERFVFPLELDAQWAGPIAFGDTSIVTTVGQIEVPAGKFTNGARIDRSWNRDFEGGGNMSQTWVVPNVGIVYRYFHSQYSDGSQMYVTTNQVWELIEYDLSTFEIERFPNEIGTIWKYEEVDSAYTGTGNYIASYDTVIVTIIDSGRFESGVFYTMWEYQSRDQTDTLYAVIDNQSLSFRHDTLLNSILDLHYEFPLAVGRTWGIDFFVPVPYVLDKTPVTTPIQNFNSSFHTRMYSGAFNYYWSQDDWLVAGTGIVKSKRWEFDFAPVLIRTRTLIEYTAP